MKFAVSFFLSAIAATVGAMEIRKGDTLTANSQIGKNLLSKARRLENNGQNAEEMMQWLTDYSLKFQGCHHLVQWNEEADGEEDVRLFKKRLVRFRLCPTNSCSESDAGGCSSDYGDYIVDMNTYLQAYYESKRELAENQCGNYVENNCNCQDNGDDNYSEEACQYDCIKAAGMEQCYQYMEDQMYAEIFEVEKYMECGQFDYNQNNNRRLDQVEYFVGPFCAEQGGAINLGMFTDDTCSTPVDEEDFGRSQFYQMAGISLPYSEKSIVGNDCLSCLQVDEDENNNNNNNNNGDEEKEITEACQQAYNLAGKCETNLPSGTSYYPNMNGCNYIEGIKVVREDGMVFYQEAHANAVTTAFIVIFAIAAVSMGVYVWYLRTRLNIKTDTLL